MPLPIALVAALLMPQAEAPVAPGLSVGGTIAVQRPAPAEPGRPAPTSVFAEATESALLDAGFIVIPHAENARHVATIAVKRTAHGAALAKGASNPTVTPTIGAGAGGRGVSIDLGSKVNVGQMVATELTISIARRGESTPVWQGTAVTYQVTGTRADDPAAVATKLATALTRNFAAPSGLSISVP